MQLILPHIVPCCPLFLSFSVAVLFSGFPSRSFLLAFIHLFFSLSLLAVPSVPCFVSHFLDLLKVSDPPIFPLDPFHSLFSAAFSLPPSPLPPLPPHSTFLPPPFPSFNSPLFFFSSFPFPQSHVRIKTSHRCLRHRHSLVRRHRHRLSRHRHRHRRRRLHHHRPCLRR